MHSCDVVVHELVNYICSMWQMDFQKPFQSSLLHLQHQACKPKVGEKGGNQTQTNSQPILQDLHSQDNEKHPPSRRTNYGNHVVCQIKIKPFIIAQRVKDAVLYLAKEDDINRQLEVLDKAKIKQ